MEYQRIALLGAGNMTQSLLGGWLAAGQPPSHFQVTCRELSRYQAQYHQMGVPLSTDNQAAVEWADIIILAVKPQQLTALLSTIAPWVAPNKVVVSVAAGCELSVIQAYFSPEVLVARAMPNVAAQCQQSATALFATWPESSSARQSVTALFEQVGLAMWLSVEAHFPLATAIAGSGPAYYCWLTEILVDAACSYGLSLADARALAAQTALGAAQLMVHSGDAPDQLRQKITSKGGTTAAAIDKMSTLGFSKAVQAGVKAAIERAFELNESHLID